MALGLWGATLALILHGGGCYFSALGNGIGWAQHNTCSVLPVGMHNEDHEYLVFLHCLYIVFQLVGSAGWMNTSRDIAISW